MSTRERIEDPEYLQLYRDYFLDVINSANEPDERFKMSPEQYMTALKTMVTVEVTVTKTTQIKVTRSENVSTASQ